MNFVYKAAATAGILSSSIDEHWNNHIEAHGISYGTHEEHHFRKQIFEKKH